ncbi:MAG TPA: 2Fe-2S iron-sulfur cluster-binding protein [Verrucomicrobiae bacterium]|nr:2Fe-2S iron-sulfur cluster-binding protein [Verrucomicrobiae bacterium]
MPEEITLTVNGFPVRVPSGATVAVAVVSAGQACRKSVTGQPRSAFCGMGICYECRVTIDGRHHCRSCQIVSTPGMDVRTDE